MADPERGLWKGPNFKEVSLCLKSNRISLAFGLTSGKRQTCMNKVALFSCYIEEYVDFVPFLAICGRGLWARSAPLDPPLKVIHLFPRLTRICVIVYLP